MKKYEKKLQEQLEKARKIALAGLGFAVIAQKKLEETAKTIIGQSEAKKLQAKAKARKILAEAVQEQKIAQKRLREDTNKALSLIVRESQKQLSKLESKLASKNKPAKKKRKKR